MLIRDKSSMARTGILSRNVLKSRASTEPVRVRFVTELSSIAVKVVIRLPGVTVAVLGSCALPINEMQTKMTRKNIFICIGLS
jgi:hypothetical protein